MAFDCDGVGSKIITAQSGLEHGLAGYLFGILPMKNPSVAFENVAIVIGRAES